MRHTVRAFIFKDKKLLVVTGHGADFYWTAGGTVEPEETSIEALHREIKEELSADIISFTPYRSYALDDQKVETFIVTIGDTFTIDNEITDYQWYDTASSLKLGEKFSTFILPDIIADGLIN